MQGQGRRVFAGLTRPAYAAEAASSRRNALGTMTSEPVRNHLRAPRWPVEQPDRLSVFAVDRE